MRREAGDHRGTEPLDVVGELAQIATGDAGIDQDQPRDPAHHGGVAPDPLALPDPDAVSYLSQHRLNLSGDSTQREWPRTSRPIRPAASPEAHARADVRTRRIDPCARFPERRGLTNRESMT